MIKLTITEKGGEARALSFDKDEVSIGRVHGNDIVLPKGNISKRHSKLLVANNRISVSDLKSTNGTYVNGRKILESTVVKAGDKIFVGDFLVVIDPTGVPAESSGLRRGPPPPPPPPPAAAPARAAGSAAMAAFEHDLAAGLDEPADPAEAGLAGLGVSRSRPPAPPPPPPRRTIVSSALRGDVADIEREIAALAAPAELEPRPSDSQGGGAAEEAMDDSPPSPAAIDSRPDPEPAASGSSDAEHAAVANMFGSAAVTDEDAAFSADFPPEPAPDPREVTLNPSSQEMAHAPDDGTPMPASEPEVVNADAPSAPLAPSAAASEAASEAPVGADPQPPVTPGIDDLLVDPAVTTILISPRGSAEIERLGTWESMPLLGDGNFIAERVWQLANTALPPPPPDNPVVDVRLPDGTRVTALFPPITPMSVCAAIRKVNEVEIPLSDLCANPDVEQILNAALASRRNLLLAGDRLALSGLVSALAGAFPPAHRVLSIGGGARARPGWTELGAGNDPGGVVRASVAFGADHLLVADPHGGDLPDLLLAVTRGQQGIMASVVARSAAEALTRLEAFCVNAIGVDALTRLVTSTIDLVIFAAAGPDGNVRICEIAEPKADGHRLFPWFAVRRADERGAASALEVVGISERLAHSMASLSEPLPPHLVRR